MAALPAAHPLAVASRLGNPAMGDGGKKPRKGHREREGGEESAEAGKGKEKETKGKGGKELGELGAKPKRHMGSVSAGKAAVVDDDDFAD